MFHVTDAHIVFAYRLWLRFNDGAESIADLRHDLEAPEVLRSRITIASA